MRPAGSALKLWSATALVGLLAALLLRALIPAGYMLAQDLAGEVALIPCSVPAPTDPVPSASNHHMAGGMEHGSGGQKHDPAPPVKCPYMALLAPPLPTTPPLLLPPEPWPLDKLETSQPVWLGLGTLASPPPPATGPPVSI